MSNMGMIWVSVGFRASRSLPGLQTSAGEPLTLTLLLTSPSPPGDGSPHVGPPLCAEHGRPWGGPACSVVEDQAVRATGAKALMSPKSRPTTSPRQFGQQASYTE